jgi:hypothetical protein
MLEADGGLVFDWGIRQPGGDERRPVDRRGEQRSIQAAGS